jgi:hypothetical protein
MIMKSKRAVVLIAMVITVSFLISSCALFKKKEKEQVYEKGKEGQWVYSQQKPSATGDKRRATSYSKRPYEGNEGTDVAFAGSETKPAGTPYLLGRLRYKVVIAEFQDNSKKNKLGLGALVTQQLSKQLEGSGAVVIVDKDLVKKSIGAGEGLSLTTPASLWKLRTLLGVQGLVIGTIQDALVGTGKQEKTEESMALTRLSVRLLDTETGNVIKSVNGENPIFTSRAVGELSHDKAMLNAIDFALQGVTDGIMRGLAGLEWSTSVASVEGDKLYLNAGKFSGLKLDDVLEICYPGREVKNPVTGVSLGRLPGQLKGTVKVSQFFGFDAAEAKIVTGRNFATGDVVKLPK